MRRLALVFLVVAVGACLVRSALFLDYLWEGATILIVVLLAQAVFRNFRTRRGRLASETVTNNKRKRRKRWKRRRAKLVVGPGHDVHLEIDR